MPLQITNISSNSTLFWIRGMLHDWIAGIIIILRSVFRAVLWNGWAPEVPNIFNSTFFNPFIVFVWFFYLSILTNYWWRTVNLINYKNRKSFESNEESTVFIWQIADPAGNILKGTQQNNPERKCTFRKTIFQQFCGL